MQESGTIYSWSIMITYEIDLTENYSNSGLPFASAADIDVENRDGVVAGACHDLLAWSSFNVIELHETVPQRGCHGVLHDLDCLRGCGTYRSTCKSTCWEMPVSGMYKPELNKLCTYCHGKYRVPLSAAENRQSTRQLAIFSSPRWIYCGHRLPFWHPRCSSIHSHQFSSFRNFVVLLVQNLISIAWRLCLPQSRRTPIYPYPCNVTSHQTLPGPPLSSKLPDLRFSSNSHSGECTAISAVATFKACSYCNRTRIFPYVSYLTLLLGDGTSSLT